MKIMKTKNLLLLVVAASSILVCGCDKKSSKNSINKDFASVFESKVSSAYSRPAKIEHTFITSDIFYNKKCEVYESEVYYVYECNTTSVYVERNVYLSTYVLGSGDLFYQCVESGHYYASVGV